MPRRLRARGRHPAEDARLQARGKLTLRHSLLRQQEMRRTSHMRRGGEVGRDHVLLLVLVLVLVLVAHLRNPVPVNNKNLPKCYDIRNFDI